MTRFETRESQQDNVHNPTETANVKNRTALKTNLQFAERSMTCRAVGVFEVHIKMIPQKPTHTFECGLNFSSESTWINHVKNCAPTEVNCPRVYVPHEFSDQTQSATNMAKHQHSVKSGEI